MAAQSSFYVTGGTLRADSPSYVERKADQELYDGLHQGVYCYVLTSRQMGKSSLMVRTAQKLRQAGITVSVLDLTAVGQNLTPEQWYGGLLSRLGAQINLETELDDFWWAHERLGPCQRFFGALEKIVVQERRLAGSGEAPAAKQEKIQAGNSATLPERGTSESRVKPKLVVFVDELDTVRSLPFSTDEFFAAIREFYTRRTEDPAFASIAFALLGVATPSDLIRDTRLTPFNIGRRIELRDFDEAEVQPLAEALGQSPRRAQAVLRRIMHWTDGHPYLTQRLCHAVALNPAISGAAAVDQECRQIFFSHRARERDDNLLFVRERLLRSEADLIKLLRLYRQVHRSTRIAQIFGFRFTLRKIEPVADEEASPLTSILRLAGIAKVENGVLRVRNRIYYRVFDPNWIDANMPVAELWRRWLVVWGQIKRMARFFGIIFLLMVLASTAALVWTRPWERIHWEPGVDDQDPDFAPAVTSKGPLKPVIPSRSADAPATTIDLSRFYNASLNMTWHPGLPNNNLSALPPGLHTFAGTVFDVRGVVQLAGSNLRRHGFPRRITGIPVHSKPTRLYILHAAGWSVSDGAQIGNYTVHFADGRRRYVPILYGQDVRDWLVTTSSLPVGDTSVVAWKEPDSGNTGEMRHRLFVTTWDNPFPDAEIASIDFSTSMTAAAPFLVAISLGP